MNPLGTKEQREELRHQHRLVNLYIPSEVKANLGLALDGLDIAEEMREVFEGLLQEAWADADVHPRHGYGSCVRCDKFWDDSIAAHAKWDKWKGEAE